VSFVNFVVNCAISDRDTVPIGRQEPCPYNP